MARIYRNNLKNRDFREKAYQNLDSEQATIAERQSASENQNSDEKPTSLKTNSSDCLGIIVSKYDRAIKNPCELNLTHSTICGFISLQSGIMVMTAASSKNDKSLAQDREALLDRLFPGRKPTRKTSLKIDPLKGVCCSKTGVVDFKSTYIESAP